MLADEMLKHAAELVGGQRAADYGDKLTNHERIAELWNFWLLKKKISSQISAYDVAMMMLLLKIARLINSPGHRDSHVDIAGYASILEEITQKISEQTV